MGKEREGGGQKRKGINWVDAWGGERERERNGKAGGSGRFYWGISWR